MITKVVLKAMPPESSTLLLQSWKEETGNDIIVVRFVAFVLLIRPFEGEVVVAVSATILLWHSNDLCRCQRQSWRSRSHGSKALPLRRHQLKSSQDDFLLHSHPAATSITQTNKMPSNETIIESKPLLTEIKLKNEEALYLFQANKIKSSV